MSATDATSRRQLAAFLRFKREGLHPADLGLQAGQRRRTPGLRREEVAALAGVSAVWYTWLEQARDIKVSREVLSGIASALELSGVERRHLFGLAGHALPAGERSDPPSATLQALVEALDPHPAYLTTACSDLLAWNRATAALIGDPAALDDSERNIIWLLFTDPALRGMVLDWPHQAKRLLADYRVEMAQHPGESRFATLTAALREASPDFRRWWDADVIVELRPHRWQFDHPIAGRLKLDFVKLAPNQPELRLVAAMPADADTFEKLPRLAAA